MNPLTASLLFLKNTYVVHRAATESSPPLIGLLGTTNVTQTHEQFAMTRGSDSAASFAHTALPYDNTSPPTPGLILAATVISTFVAGTGLGVLFRSRREKRRRDKYH